MKTYMVNEVFYSLQGEGVRAGTPNVFVRFSGCNLACSKDGEAGFDCDTEFVSGRRMDAVELEAEMARVAHEVAPQFLGSRRVAWCILTGGEPMLQFDQELHSYLGAKGWKIAMESNGTVEFPEGPPIDWLCVSPKSAEHTIRVKWCDEVKYVRHHGMGIPRPGRWATRLDGQPAHKLISPAFVTFPDTTSAPEYKALSWCIKLVKENPEWRLSVQQHKAWGVR